MISIVGISVCTGAGFVSGFGAAGFLVRSRLRLALGRLVVDLGVGLVGVSGARRTSLLETSVAIVIPFGSHPDISPVAVAPGVSGGLADGLDIKLLTILLVPSRSSLSAKVLPGTTITVCM